MNTGHNTLFTNMTNKKHNQFMKTYEMALLFKLYHTDFPPLLNSTVSKPVSSISSSLSCTTTSRYFSNKVIALSFKSLNKASNKPFPRVTHFCHGNFAPKHLHNPSQLLVFDRSNIPTKLKHYVICKSVVLLKPVTVNVNFTLISVCHRVNTVRSVFCHPHVFLAKPLFTTVKLVHPVTVCDVKSVNSAHHICRMFPSVHCTTSIHQHFSYQRHDNVTSFPLSSSNLFSSPAIKSHLPPLTLKLNLSPRPSSSLGTSSPPNFQHLLSSIKICLFLMTLFTAILLNQPTQYILVFNILTDIILFFLVYLKFCSNMSGTLILYIKQHNHFLKLLFDCFIMCNVLILPAALTWTVLVILAKLLF